MKRICRKGPAILIAVFLFNAHVHAQNRATQNDAVERQREEERARNLVARTVPNPNLNNAPTSAGAWWTNNDVVVGLGLNDDQKTRIERSFESHWRTIVFNSGQLEKEEMQLARLLEAESIDHNAVLIQTNRVIQARAEMERETAVMTLEMREQLTRTQWLKLQAMETQLRRTAASSLVPATSPSLPGQRAR